MCVLVCLADVEHWVRRWRVSVLHVPVSVRACVHVCPRLHGCGSFMLLLLVLLLVLLLLYQRRS